MNNRKFIKISISIILTLLLISSAYFLGSLSKRNQLQQITHELQTTLDSYEQLTQNINELTIEKEEVEKEYEQLDEQLVELENQLLELEKQLTDVSKYEGNLKRELEEKETLVLTQAEQIKDLKQNMEKLQSKINQLEKEKKKESNDDQVKIPTSPSTGKKIFLTFDDGPTTLTPQILNTLREKDVNATFFTIGRRMERNPDIVKQTYEEGHMVLPHSYSHDYAIYSTFKTFYNDYDKAEETYKQILGFDPPPSFRFPGGSSNHSSFNYGGKQFMPTLTIDIKEKGYTYVDWNVSSGDAGPNYNNPEKMLESIKSQSRNKDFIILLFHDVHTNQATADILPEVIQYYKSNGFAFRTFRDITEEELQQMYSTKIANKPIVR